MDVHFYNISDPPNKIKKNVSKTGGFKVENVRFTDKGALSVRNTEILINLGNNADIVEYHKFNYFYIARNQRYYFITEISAEGGLVRISGVSDPLTSFQNDILKSSQYVSRSESTINAKIVDDLLPIHSDNLIHIEPFGHTVYDENCGYCILETAGKGQVVNNGQA